MGTFTVRPEGIIRQPALTMPGNATGSEAACTALTGSQIRAICGLGTTDNVTHNILTATTSVLTPLLSTASGPLTLSSTSGMIGIGGTTSSFPALKRNSAVLEVKLADDSAFAALKVKSLDINGIGSLYIQGGAYTTLGAQNTGYPVFLVGNGSGACLRLMEGTYNYTVDIKPVGSNSIAGVFTGQGTSNPASGALATWQCAAVDNPGAALTLGNSTYGVTVPGVGGDSLLSIIGDGTKFVIEPTYVSTGSYQSLHLRASGLDSLVLSANRNVGIGGASTIGRLGLKQLSSTYQSGLAVTSVANDSSLAIWHNGSKFIIEPTYATSGSFQDLAFRTSDTERLVISAAGAATFSGDISMQKATQGYIRSHGPGAVGRYTEMYHDDAQGYVKSNFGGLVLNPAGIVYVGELSAVSAGGQMRVGYSTDTWTVFNGHINYNAGVRIFAKTTTSQGLGVSGLPGQTIAIFSCDDSGGNQLFSVEPGGGARSWGAYNTKYTQTIHDGTNGILSTSSGRLTFSPAGDITQCFRSGAQQTFRVYGADGTRSLDFSMDGTSGLIFDSNGTSNIKIYPSGSLILAPATNITGFGGITSAYPAIKRSSTTAAFRLGDDSADAPISCAGITASGSILTSADGLFIGHSVGGSRRYASQVADLGASQYYTATGQNMAEAGTLYNSSKQGGGIYFDDRSGVDPIRFVYHAAGSGTTVQALGISTVGHATFAAGITASGTVTTGGATTGQVYINQTAGAVVWGVDLQYAGSSRAFFDANGSTGETRIGGSYSSFYPVIYSGGSPCLTFNTSGNATFAGHVQETYRTSSLDPTVSDIGSGKRQGWYNTTATEFRDWVNVGGTLYKSAAYT